MRDGNDDVVFVKNIFLNNADFGRFFGCLAGTIIMAKQNTILYRDTGAISANMESVLPLIGVDAINASFNWVFW